MLTAKHPVISVNGNAASLVAEELVKLSKALNTPLEVNIFHWKKERIERIKKHLENLGTEVLAACDAVLEGLHHARRVVDGRGIYIADVVLVALEDGDRCEILKKHGKKVIAIDLNPLSRTARMADISIVDNITRAIPAMVKMAEEMNKMKKSKLKKIVEDYDNRLILKQAIEAIRDNLTLKALEVLD
jgi:4-phosphopantoate--beta-alanine ligase